MPWSSATTARRLRLLLPLFALVLWARGAADDRRLSVYSNVANYSVAVQERNGVDYVGLLESLEPLGTVTAKANGSHWKFRFYNVEGEFTAGKNRVKIRGSNFDLPASFLLENDRGLVPLSSLSILFPRFLGGPVTLHEAARRLFIGDAAVHFTAQVTNTVPPTLMINFTSPVNPSIAAEPGHIRMTFTHEPLVSPGSQTLTFGSPAIRSVTFQENNGAAELLVSGTVPLMASFSNNNRTITIASPPAAIASEPPRTEPQPASPPSPTSNPAGAPHRYFAVIDASHGGSETGAELGDQLLEKDVTLAVARDLRQELAARHLTAWLLRENDAAMTTDQRASLTNAAHPAIYICIHASSQGTGVRIFTSLIQSASNNAGPFLDWNSAQRTFLPFSQKAAGNLASALQSLKIPVRSLSAPLRPLNSITVPALAIEIAPPSDKTSQLSSPIYQEAIANLVAIGLAAAHDDLEAFR